MYLKCASGERDHTGHQAVGPRKASPDYFYNHPQSPAHAGWWCGLSWVCLFKMPSPRICPFAKRLSHCTFPELWLEKDSMGRWPISFRVWSTSSSTSRSTWASPRYASSQRGKDTSLTHTVYLTKSWCYHRVCRSCLCLLKMQHRKEICFTVSHYLLFSPLSLFWAFPSCSLWFGWCSPCPLQAQRLGLLLGKKQGSGLWFCASLCLFMLDPLIKLLFHKQMARKGVFDVEKRFPWLFQVLNVSLEKHVSAVPFRCPCSQVYPFAS